MTQFLPILETYLTHYSKDQKSFTDMIGKLEVPKQVISACYEIFVHRKELEPIESLSLSEKNKLWNIAKGYTTKKKDALMICKSLYLVQSIVK